MIPKNLIHKQRRILLLLTIIIVTTCIISLGLGYSSLSYGRLIPTLLGEGTFKEEFVLYSIRLPRMVITILAGMALALSGAILQSITRNNLADPGILGINSGAGVAVSLYFLFFPIEANSFIYMIPLIAFLGAILTAIMIYMLSYNKVIGMQPIRMVLTGVGFSLAFSGLMIVLISSAEQTKVDFIAKWIAGNIWGTDWPFVLAILPWLVILIPLTFYRTKRLDLMSLSEPVAIGIGLNIKRERKIMLFVSVALAASAVSVTGGISFIGLLSPHIAKALVGPRNQLFIPIAMLMGGWLLLLADTIGRNIADPNGVPAGIIVALIGAPYFIYLLLRDDS